MKIIRVLFVLLYFLVIGVPWMLLSVVPVVCVLLPAMMWDITYGSSPRVDRIIDGAFSTLVLPLILLEKAGVIQ